MTMLYPSGRQISIVDGEYEAVVTEVGAGIRTLTFGADHIVDGYPAERLVDGSRGQILAPWPNRLRDGVWSWNDQELRLPVDEPAKGNSASHGLVRWVAWTVTREQVNAVTLSTRLHPHPGYPFTIDFAVEYSLDARAGLDVRLSARNPGDEPAPVALGMHPYLRPLGGGPIDNARLLIPARARVLVDEFGQPVDTQAVDRTPFDFRSPALLGGLQINHAFTDLESGPDGLITASLQDEHGSVDLWTASTTRWLQVFTGDTLDGDARRRGIAVEPMTAPAGALATGTGLTVLQPGETGDLTWGVRGRRAP